jgi:protein-tyrosine phosphatase
MENGASVSQTPGDAGLAAGVRRIPVAGTFNLRDLGGYPAADGRTTRWRRLLRSDAVHLADARGTALLAGYGIRTVIDLRVQAEADLAPSPSGLAPRTLRISVLGDDLHALPRQLDAIYRYTIEERGDAIGAAIRELCGAGSVPALVHCSAGKDRTGIVIGLVLASLGVPDEVIAADYALSASYLNPRTTAAIGQLQASSGLGDELTAELLASPPGLLLDVLAWARAAGGTVEGYLAAHGVSPVELAALREELTQ